jgi:hypothetical protein
MRMAATRNSPTFAFMEMHSSYIRVGEMISNFPIMFSLERPQGFSAGRIRV